MSVPAASAKMALAASSRANHARRTSSVRAAPAGRIRRSARLSVGAHVTQMTNARVASARMALAERCRAGPAVVITNACPVIAIPTTTCAIQQTDAPVRMTNGVGAASAISRVGAYVFLPMFAVTVGRKRAKPAMTETLWTVTIVREIASFPAGAAVRATPRARVDTAILRPGPANRGLSRPILADTAKAAKEVRVAKVGMATRERRRAVDRMESAEASRAL